MKYRSTRITCILIFFSFFISNKIFGQSPGTIIGKVATPENDPLELVSVALLNPKDSTLVNFTTTDIKGEFKIAEDSRDTLLLQLFSTGYLSYFKNIIYKKELTDLKTIMLEEDIKMLDEVVITAVIPVQIKKDTVGYNASSFKIHHDDTIEELLNKLPGVEIESDGKVIAQGNEITKIYVDGKEFFGGDPSIVLKNLSADAISKVEVIDKKSDESELTGVEDGNKEVVINLTLKKSKTKNGFGKFSAGMGLDSRYFTNLNYNRFTPKNQLSFIGKFNNINITGSNIRGFLKNANGIADDSDDEDESNFVKPLKNLSGFLKTGVAGVHVGQELKKKESFNADYFYNHSENDGISKTKKINFSNSNNFENNYDNKYRNLTDNHNLNFNYENRSNKKNRLFVKGRATSDKKTSNLDRNSSFLNDVNELVTTNNYQFQNINNKNIGNISTNYFQNLLKQGRSFNIGFNAQINNLTRDIEQETFITKNINTDSPSSRDLITLKEESVKTTTLDFNFKYTEPLGSNHYFKLESYARIKNSKENLDQERITITDTTTEDLLFYDYSFRENSYKTKLLHAYNTGKLNVSTGLELQNLSRTFGEVDVAPIVKNQNFLNPSFFFVYKPKKGRKYRLTYKRYVRNPYPTQINPFVNDLNPYNIRAGNPDLKTEKTDNVLFMANVHDFKSSVSFNTRIQFQYTDDAIISVINTDEDYIKTRNYENNGNRKRLSTFIGFSRKINGLGMRYSVKNRNFYSVTNSVVNLQLNKVTSKNYMLNLALENYNKSVFDVKAGASYSVNNTNFSILNDLDRKFTKQQYYSMFDFDISKKLNFNTQFDYVIYTDDKFDTNQKLPIWNASVAYAFSKNNNILKLVLIDLLDKNVDIYRRSTQNIFEETISESLGRYVILSYTYRLNNQRKKKKS